MTVVTTCGRLHMSLQLPIYLLLVGVWLEQTGSVVTVHVAVAGVDLSGKGWNLYFLLSRCWGNLFFFSGRMAASLVPGGCGYLSGILLLVSYAETKLNPTWILDTYGVS